MSINTVFWEGGRLPLAFYLFQLSTTFWRQKHMPQQHNAPSSIMAIWPKIMICSFLERAWTQFILHTNLKVHVACPTYLDMELAYQFNAMCDVAFLLLNDYDIKLRRHVSPADSIQPLFMSRTLNVRRCDLIQYVDQTSSQGWDLKKTLSQAQRTWVCFRR